MQHDQDPHRDASSATSLEISPVEAVARQAVGALLVDVREEWEREAGMPCGALGLAGSRLEADHASCLPDRERAILTICAAGARSLRAAERLRRLGYRDVRSVAGGMRRWQAERLPVGAGGLDDDARDRYSRHLLLPQVGVAGQRRLAEARVVLVGAGGLGSPAALYLAAAGVGRLRLIDDDRVERSNLQRQILHADAHIGVLKVESAKLTLQALNPRVAIETHAERLVAENVEGLLRGADVVIDGADNFATRYLLNAACLRLGIPLIYGAVHRFTGQVSVFDPRRPDSPCYRCLFPEPPGPGEAPNCAEAGVLGVLPGSIGVLQASEALKLLLGIGEPLVGRLLCHDALAASFRELRLSRDPDCPGCSPGAIAQPYADLVRWCASLG